MELDVMAAVVGLVAGVITAMYSLTVTRKQTNTVAETASELAGRLPEPTASAEDKQYALAREYHALGLAQAKHSFRASLGFAALGFFFIGTGMLLIEPSKGLSQQGATAFALLAGAIVESVAGLFFVLSNRAQALMSSHFDKLRMDRKLDEALKMVETIQLKGLQSRTKALLTIHFSGLEAKEERLAHLIGPYQADEREAPEENPCSPSSHPSSAIVEDPADADRPTNRDQSHPT